MSKKYRFPSGHSFVKSMLNTRYLIINPIKVIQDSIDKYGDSYSVFIGINKRALFTRDKDVVRQVLQLEHRNYRKSRIQSEYLSKYLGYGLLTLNGEEWLRQRRLIQPGFSKKKIENLYGIMDEQVLLFLENLEEGVQDIYPKMNELAFTIVATTLFNTELDKSKLDLLAQYVTEIQEFIVKDIRQPQNYLYYTLNGERRKAINKGKKARQIIKDIVEERKESGEKYDDLLDMLLEATYEDTGKHMEIDQLVDEALILFIAGHETTANALSWMFYLLANHEEYTQELIAKTQGQSIEQIVANPYLRSTIEETMRLYPPVWVTDRQPYNDTAIGEYYIPKGTLIGIFFYGIHRDERYWDKPNDFIPSRFLPENKDQLVDHTYFPFGLGPRLCIGSHFAMAEMAIILQRFLEKLKIKKTQNIPKKLTLLTLRPDKVILDISKTN